MGWGDWAYAMTICRGARVQIVRRLRRSFRASWFEKRSKHLVHCRSVLALLIFILFFKKKRKHRPCRLFTLNLYCQ